MIRALLRVCLLVLPLGAASGCADLATIGGLCLVDCAATDAGPTPCTGAACDAAVEAGVAGCDAASCEEDAGPACTPGAAALSRMPTNLMLIVDDSVSVSPWYEFLSAGLLEFLQRTEPSGIGVGLQRFDEVCEREPYVTPLVPIAPLTENRSTLLQMLPLPGVVSTSTVPALDGVHLYARLWSQANRDARVSVVLLTDASPGACDGLVGDHEGEAQRIARAAAEGVPPILTYVVGFSVLPGLNSIAIAGGTEATLIGITPVVGEVRAALEAIRERSQPCAFRAAPGQPLAPGSDVIVTAPDGTARRHPILSDPSACADQDGFYLDDPASPYPLVACARTCVDLAATDSVALASACTP